MWQDIKNIYHFFVALFAAIIFGYPTRKLTVIGVTGTDGKTTTTSIIHHILNSAGYNASMITSVAAVINGTAYDTGFHVTTPSSFSVQKFLRRAADTTPLKGNRFMVLEVTSHAIDQHRIFGIEFDVTVLTNITHEHLDYHKTYENYALTKAKLLKKAKKAVVVNGDDESYKLISKVKNQNQKARWITYGMKQNRDINPKDFPFKTKLIGEFNRYNCLAAIACCRELGLTDAEIRKGLASVQAPKGREEIVHEGEFTVMVDFAHTPNATQQLLKSVKKETKGRIIHVFGSAGARDYKKRPVMGGISAKLAHISIITAEDPRKESVEKISQEIAGGIKSRAQKEKDGTLFFIPARQEAINKAIMLARKNDMVVITGKGHEQSMNFGNGEQPWSDEEAVHKALMQVK